MAVFTRGAGAHVAERVRPEPGSDAEAEMERLAADPASGWRRAVEPALEQGDPVRPAKAAAKAAWVTWAVAQGADAAEADAASKADLIAAYGHDSEPADGGELDGAGGE